MSKDKMYILCYCNQQVDVLLGLSISGKPIVRSSGLYTHLAKRGHLSVMKYMDQIPDIIQNPDYVGINPNEKDTSVEFIKLFKDANILVGVKIDKIHDYLYVSTMHQIPKKRLTRDIKSNRLKMYIDKKNILKYDSDVKNENSDEQE